MYNLPVLLSKADVTSSLRRQLKGLEPASVLSSLKLKIISNCNLRCEMCRYWRIAKQRLPLDVIFRVLEDAAGLGCQKVHLSGGEVSLYPELNAIIRHGTDLGMRINLTSNGIAVDRERSREWVAAGLRSASFSLDGVNSETHDRIRGVAGAFKKTCRAVRYLAREAQRRKSKLKIRINTVVSQLNFKQLPALTELAGRLGAVDLIPMPIDGDDLARPTAEEITRFNQKIVPETLSIRRRYGMPLDTARLYPFGRQPEEIILASQGKYGFGYYESNPCYAPWLHAFVSHDGDVYLCCMTRQRIESLGNVKQESLAEIYRGPRFDAIRRKMLQERLPICRNCDQYLKENRLVNGYLNGETQS